MNSRGKEILAHAAASLVSEKGMTHAVAESCTGGLIAHLLTEVPGISASILMGIVAYSNRAKISQLAVPEKTIREYGAVSEEVALAMASGVPVVATRVGGTPEVVIDGKTGLLVESKNSIALKEAIEKLIMDKGLALQLVNNAKKLIEEEFSVTNIANKTQGLYEELYATKTFIR